MLQQLVNIDKNLSAPSPPDVLFMSLSAERVQLLSMINGRTINSYLIQEVELVISIQLFFSKYQEILHLILSLRINSSALDILLKY